VLMVVTVRTGGLPDWVHGHALEPIVLQPLDDNGARALIDGLLGPAPALAALKQRVLDHTGRLPLFVIEVCRRLAELGRVAGEAGNFRLASLSAVLDVPPTVYGVIAARVDRLSPDNKRVLQIAAVIGRRIPISLLTTVAELSEQMLGERLRSLDREAARLLSSARHRIIHGGVQPPLSSHVMHLPLMCTFILVNCCFALGDAEAVEAHHRFSADIAEQTRLPLAQFATAFSRGILLLLRD